jgi:hypothetical protein
MGERGALNERDAGADERDDTWVSLPLSGAREEVADAGTDAKTRHAVMGSHLITFLVSADASSGFRCLDSKSHQPIIVFSDHAAS